MLQESTADDCMEKSLVEWRMNWQKVLKLGICSHSTQAQNGAGNISNRAENKKSRGGRKEGRKEEEFRLTEDRTQSINKLFGPMADG